MRDNRGRLDLGMAVQKQICIFESQIYRLQIRQTISILEEFEDTKGVIQIRISKKNKQHNGQKKKREKKDKQRSTKHTHKTKDRVTRTLLRTGGELRCSRTVRSSCSTSGTHRVNLVKSPMITHI